MHVGLHLVGLFDLVHFSCIPIALVRSKFIVVLASFLFLLIDLLCLLVTFVEWIGEFALFLTRSRSTIA